MTTPDPRSREALVASMAAMAADMIGELAAMDSSSGRTGRLVLPGNVSDDELAIIAGAVQAAVDTWTMTATEAGRTPLSAAGASDRTPSLTLWRDAKASWYSNATLYRTWGDVDGNLTLWLDVVSTGTEPILTFTVSMHDVLDAWRGRFAIQDEDGNGAYVGGVRTVEEAIIVAAANQLATSVKGDYIQQIVKREVGDLIRAHASEQITEWVTAALAEPVQPTDGLGRPQGQPTSVFELAQKALTDLMTDKKYDANGKKADNFNSRGDTRYTLAEAVVRTRVTGHLTKELNAVVDAAKAEVVDAVKDEATTVVSTVLADRLAKIGEGRN